MSFNKKIIRVLGVPARLLAGLIAGSPRLIDWFRHREFRGKELIGGHLKLKAENEVYTCFGGAKFDVDFRDGIQRAIYLGLYERHELRFLESYVQKGWTCLDVGGNVGFYALHLSRLVGPRGLVYSVEASRDNYIRLLRNIELNDLGHCHACCAALTSATGPVRFTKSRGENSGWGRVGSVEGLGDVVEVEGLSLKDFSAKYGLSEVHFMKVDIEGHELDFLAGAADQLRSGMVKRLFIEYSGYAMQAVSLPLNSYVKVLSGYGFVPRHMNLDLIRRSETHGYTGYGETINLLMEHESLGR